MKIDKSDFAPIEKLENDMEAIQLDAMKLAETALMDTLQAVFDVADEKNLSDRDYIKEVISGAAGAALQSSALHTGHMVSNYVPIIVELAYQNSSQRIASNLKE
ncbi:hypothetical protein CHH91_04395 [Virgibacillus sp. 7505]|uniref:hypothetical protein n=1 Tax=Virgibacillus sp. 7505 TaxID=2022548 RepID=UPI000BA69CBB|nr:hypothetical protein [Virgibacillus sp. 7505]PAE17253.1 hypothetical protein CHH91_04395 [Virgibacillus sp. 7505]